MKAFIISLAFLATLSTGLAKDHEIISCPPTACTEQWDPVCGKGTNEASGPSFAKTYGNICEFRNARCTKDPSLVLLHKGVCTEAECSRACILIYKPVCGSDGITYGNTCAFFVAQCSNPGMTFKEGECKT